MAGKIKLNVGDDLFEPLSRNIGRITQITEHPAGKLVKIRWRVDDNIPHDTEHFYKKVRRCVENGDYEHTPAPKTD